MSTTRQKRHIKKLMNEMFQACEPPPLLTVGDWAETHRVVPKESSARHGKWNTNLVEYLRFPMEVVSSNRVEQVVLKTAAQVAKTEFLLNVCCKYLHVDRSSILVLFPNMDLCESFSKDRLTPTLRDTPALQAIAPDQKSRSSSNTILNKQMKNNAHITMASTSSPASLSARACQIVAMDELDRSVDSSGGNSGKGEGDPVELAIKRADTFWNRKVVLTSTPTSTDTSKIEKRYQESKRFELRMPCHHCGEYIDYIFEYLVWEGEDPDTTKLKCPKCESLMTNAQAKKAVKSCKWFDLDPEKSMFSVGFHVSSLHSPFVPLSRIVRKYLEARGNPHRMRVFVNTMLGLSYDEDCEQADPDEVKSHMIDYEFEVPADVLIITAGVDMQQDRAEIHYVGYTQEGQPYVIDYRIYPGDPTSKDFWMGLVDMLSARFQHAHGYEMPVSGSCIDSGGLYTKETYSFCKSIQARRLRIFAVKGEDGWNKPIVGPPARKKYGRDKRPCDLYPVAVDVAKEMAYASFKSSWGSSNYCFFPNDPEKFTDEYFAGLTAEKIEIRYKRGFPVRCWILKGGRRNEQLDTFVYSLACLHILNPLWSSLKRRDKTLRLRARNAGNEVNKKAQKRPEQHIEDLLYGETDLDIYGV